MQYIVNDHGEIVWVSGLWTAFARENGGDAIADAGSVLSRSLFSFITPGVARRAFERLLDRMLAEPGGRARLEPRCDSPTVERDTVLDIRTVTATRQAMGVLFDSRIQAERRRPAPLAFLGLGDEASALEFCGFCAQVRSSGAWLKIRQHLTQAQTLPSGVRRTLCPACEELIWTVRIIQ